MIRYLARLSVNNPVAVHLASLALLAAGVMAFLQMPREVFPESSLGTVTVTTLYPASAPEDVERLITLPLEESLEGLDGRKDLSSVSQEGYSLLTLTAHTGTDMDRFVEDIRTAVRSGDVELPEDAEEPLVKEIKAEFPVIGFFIYGQASEEQLRSLAEEHKRQLERIDGVAQVIMQGDREPRIWVEVEPASLERYGLTLAQVGAAVRARSQDAPVGTLETSSGDYLLRVDAGVQRAEDLRDLYVLRRADGSGVRLSEVARVVDAFERRVTASRFNGQPSIYLRVTKKARGDAISISRAIYEHIEQTQGNMPPGTAVGTNSDLSVYVRNRLNVMRDSALIGGVLVLISLILFLNLRIALMTALGIPFAFLGGIVMAFGLGLTMNMLTMFALIVVLGMIVDDAIVVGENAYRLMEEGMSPEQAAVQGTAEVGQPVMATIFTTIAAFMPLLMISGTMGSFMRPMPLIVSFCLLASLAEAFLILPAHLAHWSGRHARGAPGESERRWYAPLRRAYVRLLGLAFDYRYVTLTAAGVLVGLVLSFGKLHVPFVLFDDFESKVFSVNLRMVPGTSMAETNRLAARLEEQVEALPAGELESTNVIAGVSFVDATRFTVGQNLAQVWVELHEGEAGRRATSEILEDLRERFRELPPGVESIELVQPQAGPTGRALEVSLRGPVLDVLRDLSADLQGFIAGFSGTRDVHDSSDAGKRELRLRLTDAGRLLGFNEAGLARELRAAFTGTRYSRVRRGKDDVEIMVKLPEELRMQRGALAQLPVALPAGAAGAAGASPGTLPLGTLVQFHAELGPSVISRDDGQRAVTVSADVNKSEGNAAEIAAAISAHLALPGELPPGYSYAFKGEQEEANSSFSDIGMALIAALFMIYMILGTLFRSMLQPFVIMGAIPFGLVGMVGGHVLLDRPLSFLSMIGFVALTGIVVNDSLILQDFINRLRSEGVALREAVVRAGHQRFRPIVLTSVTTMLGLSPLTFFASGQARFLQPMAITIFFGLASSTLLILVVIPCAYAILDDLLNLTRRASRRFFHGRAKPSSFPPISS